MADVNTGGQDARLPNQIRPAETGTATIHAAWYNGSDRTLCDRAATRWRHDLGREGITCRTCVTRLGRMRFPDADYDPPVSVAELELWGFVV